MKTIKSAIKKLNSISLPRMVLMSVYSPFFVHEISDEEPPVPQRNSSVEIQLFNALLD